jgi:hypothetical protein
MADFVIGDYIWDENKSAINAKKHGVTFMEARTVFDDINAIYRADDIHSRNEERFVVIGESEKTRLLMVCHCYFESGNIKRLISARKADKQETNLYKKGE